MCPTISLCPCQISASCPLRNKVPCSCNVFDHLVLLPNLFALYARTPFPKRFASLSRSHWQYFADCKSCNSRPERLCRQLVELAFNVCRPNRTSSSRCGLQGGCQTNAGKSRSTGFSCAAIILESMSLPATIILATGFFAAKSLCFIDYLVTSLAISL